MGTPASTFTNTEYGYTFYDSRPEDNFSGDWVMIANMGGSTAHV